MQLGEIQLGEMQSGEMQSGEMQLSRTNLFGQFFYHFNNFNIKNHLKKENK